jgi:hypothetical protein
LDKGVRFTSLGNLAIGARGERGAFRATFDEGINAARFKEA